ncbi:MAG: YgjP-like metallopeptidase domain-containing protein [Pacificimonas sp.]
MVRRAVAAHEVAHLVHRGHGPDFHALADELAGGTQAEGDAWLRAHGNALHGIGRQ